eukprot:g2564.t1
MKTLTCCIFAAGVVAGVAVEGNVTLYFGSGCFFGRQHDFAAFEQSTLGRADADITSIAGFAGSALAGPGGLVCYHNANNTADYQQIGHAEVVSLTIPLSAMRGAADVFFRSFISYGAGVFGREDYFDQGPGYRALVGLPGGAKNGALMAQLHAANVHNMSLTPSSAGADEDTFQMSRVYVMDSTKFPFHQADLCLQFHDNMTGTYDAHYHGLKQVMLDNGRLRKTGCPVNYICGP